MRVFIVLCAISVAIGSCTFQVAASKITVINGCDPMKIWIGIQGQPALDTSGFELAVGESRVLEVPRPWIGARIWARTHCNQEPGRFVCKTGDCGQANGVACNGAGGVRPATLAEFTLAAVGGQDFYDVSNVDGSNLPIRIRPINGAGETCKEANCLADINKTCPPELQVLDYGYVVGCRSPCAAFGGPLNCCEGAHDRPETCAGTKQAYEVFKAKCPLAYSYQYDDKNSCLFTCWGNTDYEVKFCP